MKIAICFSGQIRTGVLAADNIKKYIGELYDNVDFFMHTWDISQAKEWNSESVMSKKYNIVNSPKINDGRLLAESMNTVYDNKFKKISVDNFERWNNRVGSNFMYFSPLWYSWQKSVLLKKQFEVLHGFMYDIVIKMRPDIIFPDNRSLIHEVMHYCQDRSKFYAMGHGEERIDDVMFLSSSALMDRASQFFDSRGTREWSKNLFGEYLLSKNIVCYNTKDTLYTILREEALNCTDNFMLCFNIDRDYYTDTEDRLPLDYDRQNPVC